MDSLTPDAMVRAVTGLPVTPQVLPKLQRLLRDVNSSLDDVADLVRLEPVLSAQIVRLSNTAAYGSGRKCATVEESFNRIGFRDVEKLVSLAVVAGIVEKPLPTYRLTGALLWTRSVATALAAERLAGMLGANIRVAYSCGLLSQVGLLVIDRYSARQPVVFAWEGFPGEYRRGEEAAYGFTGYDVGAALMQQWGFVEEVWSPLAGQSRLAEAKPGLRTMATILYVARFLRSVLCDENVKDLDAELLAELDLTAETVLGLASEVRGELFQAKRMI
jgi:HD-like signal output (HDOD) protein